MTDPSTIESAGPEPVPVPPAPATPESAPPAARVIPERSSLSPVWLLPVGAVVAVIILLYQAIFARGPLVSIRFEHGDGIAPGDPVTYRGVRIGEVETVSLAEDLTAVLVGARLQASAAGHAGKGGVAVEGSRFWIVRPEVSLTRVSGLDTLLGPRYIEVDPGPGEAPSAASFVGLAGPPPDARRTRPIVSSNGDPPLRLVLESPTRGSIRIGAPVLYRGVRVGVVEAVALADSLQSVEVRVAVDATRSTLVRANTKFWNASGIGLDFGVFSGVTLEASSLESVLEGGIEFATPTKLGEAISDGHRFALEPKPDEDWLKWKPSFEPPPAP